MMPDALRIKASVTGHLLVGGTIGRSGRRLCQSV